jgi:putative heme iron utilization protein
VDLKTLIDGQRIASLGTLYRGAPLVTLVPYAATPDFGAFYIHISRLAQHTEAILADARVGLMIAEPDAPGANPQTLARLSLRGEASPDPGAKDAYLARFPEAAFNFTLADFTLYRITPLAARFVAGFGRIADLSPADLARAATLPPSHG